MNYENCDICAVNILRNVSALTIISYKKNEFVIMPQTYMLFELNHKEENMVTWRATLKGSVCENKKGYRLTSKYPVVIATNLISNCCIIKEKMVEHDSYKFRK